MWELGGDDDWKWGQCRVLTGVVDRVDRGDFENHTVASTWDVPCLAGELDADHRRSASGMRPGGGIRLSWYGLYNCSSSR